MKLTYIPDTSRVTTYAMQTKFRDIVLDKMYNYKLLSLRLTVTLTFLQMLHDLFINPSKFLMFSAKPSTS